MLVRNPTFSVERSVIDDVILHQVQGAARAFFAQADAGRVEGHRGYIAQMQDGVSLGKDDANLHIVMMREIFDLVHKSRALLDEIRVRLGAGSALLPSCSSIRRQRPGGKPLPWHQDAVAMGTDDPADGMVIWIPLVDIDSATPSLEFLVADTAIMQHTGGANGFAELAHEPIGPTEICPRLSVGDALILGLNTVHRTLIESQHIKVRYSCDLRVGSAAYLENRDLEAIPCG